MDDGGHPIDHRFLEKIPRFEKATGLRDPVGRLAPELVPSLEPSWVETYATVALGETRTCSAASSAANRRLVAQKRTTWICSPGPG